MSSHCSESSLHSWILKRIPHTFFKTEIQHHSGIVAFSFCLSGFRMRKNIEVFFFSAMHLKPTLKKQWGEREKRDKSSPNLILYLWRVVEFHICMNFKCLKRVVRLRGVDENMQRKYCPTYSCSLFLRWSTLASGKRFHSLSTLP